MYNLVCTVLFALNGVLRLCLGVIKDRPFEFVLAAVWLLGASVWFHRYQKENKNGKAD